MRERQRRAVLAIFATLLTVTAAAAPSAWAQSSRPHRSAALDLQRTAVTPAATYRGLTINRQPQAPSDAVGDEQDIYQDGPIRYNDIRDFSPSPYTTSGVQYPYGLDGIGGFGSDLGFASGQDSALYNRGAGSLR